MTKALLHRIGLGGGCHWCTEAVFQQLKGVTLVEQGWIASIGQNESFSEAISLSFDPEMISLETIIQVHLLTHSSTSAHSMRGKYRSAIYFSSQRQESDLKTILHDSQSEFDSTLITQVLPLIEFRLNEEPFLNYYQKQPEAPFCETYISPKLKLLREKFSAQMRERE